MIDLGHDDGCRCVICSGEMIRTKWNAWESKQMANHGWFAHSVIGDPQSPTGVNYHTHGIQQSIGCSDLQLVFPAMRSKDRHAIAQELYRQMKAGASFGEGNQADIAGKDGPFRVHFIKVREGDREVLRVILPTPDGKLEPSDVAEDNDPFYSLQWTVTAV